MFSSALTSSCSPPLSLLVFSLLLLDPSHWHYSDYWVLVELTLAVHQTISFGSFDPHPFVDLPRHCRLEGPKDFHRELYFLSIMLQLTMLPESIVLLLHPQPTCLLLSSAEPIGTSLPLVLCAFSNPPAAFTRNPIA